VHPLKVALVIKNSGAPLDRECRNMGYWSYAVPEFEWQHFIFDKGASINLNDFRDFDIVFHEDTTNDVTYKRTGSVPLIFLDIDSTLSDEHLRRRKAIAIQSDLVLCDHSDLENFAPKCARRLNYCVNDMVFKSNVDHRSIDIVFHCSNGGTKNAPGAKERASIRSALDRYAKNARLIYRSGVLGLEDYANAMGTAEIVVNWPRTPQNRPHRVFDAMACGAFLLTGSIPIVEGDLIDDGKHFVSFCNENELIEKLEWLTSHPGYMFEIASAGYELVMEKHTWKVRAAQLRQMLSEEFDI
jgi:hypothetical protein